MSIFNGKAEDIFNKKSDYPIGSICMFKANIDPNELYGGTWVRIKGKFILGADDSIYPLGSEGGEAKHKLTVDEMPSHKHRYLLTWANTGTMSRWFPDGSTLTTGDFQHEDYMEATGGDQAHNNMPPYVALYIWTKVA